MSEKEINFKDLSKSELEILKDNYVASRLACMTEADLIAFAKAVIEDQVKGTVGNEEEKEAWEEIKEHFKENFDLEIKKVITKMYLNQKDFVFNVKDLSLLLVKDTNQHFYNNQQDITQFNNIKNESKNKF